MSNDAIEIDNFRLTKEDIAPWPVGARVQVKFPFPKNEGGGTFRGSVVVSSEGCLSHEPWERFCLLMVALDSDPKRRFVVVPGWLAPIAEEGEP